MKISFILAGDARSGGIKAPIQSACLLFKRGYNIRLLVNAKTGSIKEYLRSQYMKVRFPEGSSWLHLFNGEIEKFKDLTECSFEKNEIVVAHGWWAKKELQRIMDQSIIKVHFLHGVASMDIIRDAWKENVPKIAVASYLDKVSQDVTGQKLHAVIENGIDTTEFFPSVPESYRDGVGTIFGDGYHKDPETVLGVIEALRQSNPDLPIRVFGACRRPKEIPAEIFRRLPSKELIREIYSKSRVWFLGSCSEGFPAPILEAMACGCAVVSTDCGGPRDMIKDGVNGFLCEVGNIKQIKEKIETLLDDDKLRKQFVEESKKTVQKFSWENSVDKLEQALKNIYQERIG